MKIILKEYLASLKERGDLDKSVLPNLLSEIGLRVLNTPMLGTRQNGVDIAAVGKIRGEDTQKYLYLFCIKAGNISRSDWGTGLQGVRNELDDITEIYVRSNVAKEYADLPIKICLCCGGELSETVLSNWAGYTAKNTTDRIFYEEWNGDRLAELMMRSLLARELLDEEPRRSFQKAVALVNEPSACYEYVRSFLGSLLPNEQLSEKSQLLRLRQAYICLHAVIAWSIDAKNLESTFKVSELGLLFCWNSIRKNAQQPKASSHYKSLMLILDQFLKLYLTTSEMYIKKAVSPYSKTLHALSVAVRSRESVDVNLTLYELIGRLAVRGLWTHMISTDSHQSPELLQTMRTATSQTVDMIIAIINSNPALHSPIRDDHMIEIALVMYLAQLTKMEERFFNWLRLISDRTTIALFINSQYPTCMQDYSDLLSHPLHNEQSYRDEACAGSILYPYLYVWLHRIASRHVITEFTGRLTEKIPDCTHQAWLPDEDSDSLIWSGHTYHGICVTDLVFDKDFDQFAKTLNSAIETCTAISEISAIKAGLVPLFLMACRHYRLPIPPNFWVVQMGDHSIDQQ